ncbi:MAG: GNAT family N-acetyltransferase [Clostridia bacterium]|nr:GNAT family N-acetyltransferase [Clostridia bacterium]
MIDYIMQIGGESDNLTFGKGELEITLAQEEDTLQQYNEDPLGFFMIAEHEGKIIGNINLKTHNRARVRHNGEFGVSVLKAYWRNGIAEVLIGELIEWAKAGGVVTKIDLRVRDDNAGAIALYKKMGFVEEGHISRQFLIDGVYYSAYYMGLKL